VVLALLRVEVQVPEYQPQTNPCQNAPPTTNRQVYLWKHVTQKCFSNYLEGFEVRLMVRLLTVFLVATVSFETP